MFGLSRDNISFVTELKSLLKKHGVALTAKDHYTGYPECGEDVRIAAEFENWQVLDLDLGSYFDNDSEVEVI